MSGAYVERVPGVRILVDNYERYIEWPSGEITKMKFWPLEDRDQYYAYLMEPVYLGSHKKE